VMFDDLLVPFTHFGTMQTPIPPYASSVIIIS
jgi:hypothetical protein